MSEANMDMAMDINSIPLEQVDVSNPSIFESDTWQPWFSRLRQEAPVHYCPESAVGAYWSVTSHDLIKQVDTNHDIFSSAEGIAIPDAPEDLSLIHI